MKNKIILTDQDITKLEVDVIVNAANKSLLGGGGVDGAIHRAAGPELLEKCRTLNGCLTGEAKITPGYKLPAKFIIHTVGPIWENKPNDPVNPQDLQLSQCYLNSLRLANAYGLKTIAFPAISCGVYRFPIDRAARIALAAIQTCFLKETSIEKIYICCFTQEIFLAYENALKDLDQHDVPPVK